MTTIVHCKKSPYDIYIGRGKCPNTGLEGIWGNPYSHKPSEIAEFSVDDRATAIAGYKKWILTQPQILKNLHTLKGKTLGCWCSPLECHGDVLLQLVHRTKLAVIGSRNFTNESLLGNTLDWVLEAYPDSIIVSGGASGADCYAAIYARRHGIELIEFIPDWQGLGKRAGFARNEDIINNCDVVVALWDGVSKGTAHSLSLAKKAKKTTIIQYF